MNISAPTKEIVLIKPERSIVLPVPEMVRRLESAGLEFEVRGDYSLVCDHPANLSDAGPESVCFYNGEDSDKVAHLRESVLICQNEFETVDSTVVRIICDRPRLAFAVLAQAFAPPLPPPGIHPTAVVDPKAEVDPTAYIGPYCVLEECRVGPRSVLYSHVTVFSKTNIGADTVIEPNVCIGQFGNGFEWGPDGRQWIIPQLGGTLIGDHCYVGASSVISRGTMQDTILENRVRIDENSLIGHNSYLGEGTFVANGIAMAGMTTIGRRCWLGTGSSYCNQVTLGNFITVGVGTVVTKDFREDGLVLVGVPARIHKKKTKGANVRADLRYDDLQENR